MLKLCSHAGRPLTADTSLWPSIRCTFFGCTIRYCAPDTATIDRIRYIFRYFLDDLKPDQSLEIALTSSGSFVNAILSPQHDAIVHYRENDTEDWAPWPSYDTPFPPLLVGPLKGQYVVLHGCAVVGPDDQAVAFIAPSLTGKTTLLVELCNRGYHCISDDLLFIRSSTLQVYRYPKPVGIRDGMFSLFPSLRSAAAVKDALVFKSSGGGGTTWLVHLDELLTDCYCSKDSLRLKACVVVERETSATIAELPKQEAIASALSQVVSSGCSHRQLLRTVSDLVTHCSFFVIGTSDLQEAAEHAEVLLEQTCEEGK